MNHNVCPRLCASLFGVPWKHFSVFICAACSVSRSGFVFSLCLISCKCLSRAVEVVKMFILTVLFVVYLYLFSLVAVRRALRATVKQKILLKVLQETDTLKSVKNSLRGLKTTFLITKQINCQSFGTDSFSGVTFNVLMGVKCWGRDSGRRCSYFENILLCCKLTVVFLQLEHRLSLTDPSKVMTMMMMMMSAGVESD